VTRQRWQDRAEWVTATVQTYDAIVDETTWHQVAGLIAANTRTNAVTSTRHRTRSGVRRSEPSRYPLAGLVVCDCCDKKLQGNLGKYRRALSTRRKEVQPIYLVSTGYPRLGALGDG
jgi:hypothetical protein